MNFVFHKGVEVSVVAVRLTSRRTLFREFGQLEVLEPENRVH